MSDAQYKIKFMLLTKGIYKSLQILNKVVRPKSWWIHKPKLGDFISPFFISNILQSGKDQRVYYGQTQDIDIKVDKHNADKFTYTKIYTTVIICLQIF